MYMKKYIVLMLLLFLVACDNPKSHNNDKNIKENYEESIESFVNPDCGFYYPICLTAEVDGLEKPGSQKHFYNNALIHLRIDIAAFSSKYNNDQDLELSSAMLSGLDEILKTINDSGSCVIIRFAYDRDFDGAINCEPAIDMILRHIEQFSILINKHKNMITAVECGLIGPWGEMHSSTIANQSTYNKLFDKYLECLDVDVVLLVRRPKFIYEYYGIAIDSLNEFNYEQNRLGCYNDGYLGSDTDLGTFVDREKEIEFLEKLSRFPYGGEVVRPKSEFNNLTWACNEMFKTNLSYLNLYWNDQVIERWQQTPYTLNDPLYKGQTEFTYIANHLGYRFVCESMECLLTNTLKFNLKIKNVGFGNLIRKKAAFVIIKNDDNQYVFNFKYNNELDINYTIDVTNIVEGKYDLFFVLADDFNDKAVRGIRFANTNMFDDTIYANKLTSIVID